MRRAATAAHEVAWVWGDAPPPPPEAIRRAGTEVMRVGELALFLAVCSTQKSGWALPLIWQQRRSGPATGLPCGGMIVGLRAVLGVMRAGALSLPPLLAVAPGKAGPGGKGMGEPVPKVLRAGEKAIVFGRVCPAP